MEFELTFFELTFSDGSREYTIRCDEDGVVWLSNEVGEAMEVSSKNMFDVLDEYFSNEF